jgi:HicA toxin of bacterial toxin-antitoxin,
MDRRRLKRIRQEAESLRSAQAKARELERLAARLGRKKVVRGKHPMYESGAFPHLRPLSIPNHKGRDMPPGTKNSILNQLEDDLDAWDEALSL